jgi:hypothetical protein
MDLRVGRLPPFSSDDKMLGISANKGTMAGVPLNARRVLEYNRELTFLAKYTPLVVGEK